MGFSLESLTKVHVFSQLEDLPLEQALKKLQASCKGRNFRMETNVHKDSFKDPQTGRELKPIIQIAAKDFTILCENIIDNAERHGFSDINTEHIIRIDVFLNAQEQMVDISFKNTGQHLPEGLTVERFVTRGEKGGVTANTGIGGHHIKSLMDHANGNVKIQDLADDIFRVEVKLSFPFHL
jgi:K+-sensing histidine kinase KdpD